jgi:hypothetical protein
VERQDVRVREARDHPNLLQEALGAVLGGGQVRRSTFTATGRSCFTPCARNTKAIPPRPSSVSI